MLGESVSPTPSKRQSNVHWFLVIGMLCLIIVSMLYGYLRLQSDYQELNTKYSSLSSRFSDLQSSYSSLNSLYAQLQVNLSSLKQSYSSLQSKYTTLQGDYNNLKQSYSSLESRYTTLQTTYAQLQSDYSSLNKQYGNLKQSYDSLQSESKATHDWIDTISLATTLRAGTRPKELVTPDDQLVASTVLQCTGGWTDTSNWNEYWADLRKMYDWVKANVEYSYDSPLLVIYGDRSSYWDTDYWRYPSETIADKHGDCEDQALLLCSMIRNYNSKKYTIWVVKVQGHLAVMFPVEGGKLAILDPAGAFFTSTTLGQLTSKPASTAIQEWATYWASKIPNLTIAKIFNESFEQSFSSNSDFLSWLAQNYPP